MRSSPCSISASICSTSSRRKRIGRRETEGLELHSPRSGRPAIPPLWLIRTPASCRRPAPPAGGQARQRGATAADEGGRCGEHGFPHPQCAGEDLNLHDRYGHQALNLARLPIPPPARGAGMIAGAWPAARAGLRQHAVEQRRCSRVKRIAIATVSRVRFRSTMCVPPWEVGVNPIPPKPASRPECERTRVTSPAQRIAWRAAKKGTSGRRGWCAAVTSRTTRGDGSGGRGPREDPEPPGDGGQPAQAGGRVGQRSARATRRRLRLRARQGSRRPFARSSRYGSAISRGSRAGAQGHRRLTPNRCPGRLTLALSGYRRPVFMTTRWEKEAVPWGSMQKLLAEARRHLHPRGSSVRWRSLRAPVPATPCWPRLDCARIRSCAPDRALRVR